MVYSRKFHCQRMHSFVRKMYRMLCVTFRQRTAPISDVTSACTLAASRSSVPTATTAAHRLRTSASTSSRRRSMPACPVTPVIVVRLARTTPIFSATMPLRRTVPLSKNCTCRRSTRRSTICPSCPRARWSCNRKSDDLENVKA